MKYLFSIFFSVLIISSASVSIVNAQLAPIDAGYGPGVAVPPGAEPGNPIQDSNSDPVQENKPGTGKTGGLVPCSGLDCDMCSFVSLIENLVDWLVGVMLVIFAIVTAYAGFKLVMSGGNPQAKTEAKEFLTNAFIGIIIVLTAWILIDTLMRAILPSNGEIKGGPWSSVQCYKQVPPGSRTVDDSGGQSGVLNENDAVMRTIKDRDCEVLNTSGGSSIINCTKTVGGPPAAKPYPTCQARADLSTGVSTFSCPVEDGDIPSVCEYADGDTTTIKCDNGTPKDIMPTGCSKQPEGYFDGWGGDTWTCSKN